MSGPDESADDIKSKLARLIEPGTGAPEADLRTQARKLVKASTLLRKLGARLLPGGEALSAKARILEYLRVNAGSVVDGDELMAVAGISEYARRIRELRVQEGWPILSGMTGRDLRSSMSDELPLQELPPEMRPDQYLLQEDRRDLDAARRWAAANQIRRSRAGVQAKLLRFFRENVGQRITSEELRYVSGDTSEWARRTRELRTEEGWPIVTKFTGDPDLPMGVYVLARDEQAPAHDRHIPEIVRREVMQRDDWRCRWNGCGWSPSENHRDPRFLEVHHLIQHAHGGSNEAVNLVTLCNLHHDEVHRSGRLEITDI
ncbi:MAG: HNH endonuclease [Sphingosinicella sp.]|uniref:HNH endonuclease n=1 Tax=Sphingosinicella sp. TaxID=1917971 RepID=UPI004037AB11